MGDTRRRLAVLAILAVGTALRMGPLYRSPLPFNPDGVIYAGLTAHTLATDVLPLGQMAVDSLAFTSFLAVLAQITGATPLSIAQPAIAIVGTATALLAVAITHRLARQAGWPTHRAWQAALLAGAILAVEGLYLHRSMPVDEQTAGLLVAPLAVYAIARTRTDTRYALVAAPALAVLPVLHNLDTVVTAIALLVVAALATPRDPARTALSQVGTAVAFAVYAVAATLAVAAWTPTVIVQADRLASVPGLLLAWVVAVIVGTLWVRLASPRGKRLAVLAPFVAGFALLAANVVHPIYPGLPGTPPRLFGLLAPLGVVVLAAAVAVPLAHGDAGRAIAALVAAVLALVGVSVTASLTAPYLNTVYRAQTFVHLPVAALAGLGTTALARRSLGTPARRAVVVAVVLIAAAASIPVAFAGLELLPYKGTTTPAELAASGHALQYVEGEWASDDHLARITNYYRPNPRYRTEPRATVLAVATWTTGGDQPPCPTLAQRSWTSTGAQLYPRSPATLSARTYEAWTRTNDVVYAATGPDPIVLVIPPGSGC